MEVSSSHQVYVFSMFVLMGAMCGALFDIQRFLRTKKSAGYIRTAVEDVVFSFICIGIMIVSSFQINNGEIRYYQVMGAISGVLFYAAFLSRVFLKTLSVFFRIAEKIFVKPIIKIACFITSPVKKFLIILKRRFARIRRKIRSIKQGVKRRKGIIKKRAKML